MELVKVLGKGAYGSVYLYAEKKKSLGFVQYEAVKVSDTKQSLEKELRILTQLRGCPRVVQLSEHTNCLEEDIDSNGTRVFGMAMEYASGGTLSNLIRTSQKLSDSTIKDLTRMILEGLESVHEAGYVHCDLKPDNLLLFPRYHDCSCSYDLKIADFGVSTRAGEQSDLWNVGDPWVGTPVYMSPESVQECVVHPSLDLWSLGCIVLEMYTAKYPWFGLAINQVESNLMYDLPPIIPMSGVPSDARLFIDKCFSRKPQDRGTASELLSHPFLIAQETAQLKRKFDEPKSSDVMPKKLKRIHPRHSLSAFSVLLQTTCKVI